MTEGSGHFEATTAEIDRSWTAVTVNTRSRIRCRTQVSIQWRGDLLLSGLQAPKEKKKKEKAWVTKALLSLVPQARVHVSHCLESGILIQHLPLRSLKEQNLHLYYIPKKALGFFFFTIVIRNLETRNKLAEFLGLFSH